MSIASLLGSIVGGVFHARPKRHARALDFLTGSRGQSGGSFLNGTTLLTAAALGWGAYEVWRTRPGAQAGSVTSTVMPGLPPASGGAISTSTVVGSVPRSEPRASTHSEPPPLPSGVAGTAIDPLRRLVGVLLAAARSDGELGEREYGHIVKKARDVGAAELVTSELAQPTPLEALAGGIQDERVRAELYQLAFAVVAADEGVRERERAWLDRLAGLLALDLSAVTRLERDVNDGIARSA